MELRIFLFLFQIIFFSIIYFSLDDSHFSGINLVEELIKDEIIKKNITSSIKEDFDDKIDVNIIEKSETPLLKKKTKQIKMDVKNKDISKETISPSKFQKFFDRFYFSFTTGATLGFGDIVPKSNLCKFIVMIQLFATALIVFFFNNSK